MNDKRILVNNQTALKQVVCALTLEIKPIEREPKGIPNR